MMIKVGKIQKAKKKSLKSKGKGKANGKENDKRIYIPNPKNPKLSAKEHIAKDDTCHHYKEGGHWKRNCPVYLTELLKKKKQVGSASSLGIFIIELFAFPNKSWVYETGCGIHICITKQGFREARKLKQGALYLYVGNGVCAQVEAIGSFYLVLPNVLVICSDNCHYAPSIIRGVVSFHRLVENGFVQCFTDYKILVSKNSVFYFNVIPSNGIYEIDMHDLVPNINGSINVVSYNSALFFWDCASRVVTRLLNMVLTKKVDKTPYELWYGKVHNLSYLKVWGCEALVKRDTPDKLQQRSLFEKNLITQESQWEGGDLEEEIQDEDTTPSKIIRKFTLEVEGFEPPQEEVILIRRSERTHQAPDHLCLNVEVEEHSLGDLNEPTSYKAAMLDSESNKWIDAMNAEIQSMIDNMVWVLVDLPPNCKTVGSKWIFKKKTDMDGIVHTYKARLVAKGYTQLYGVDYEETFSPVADIRAIRILISIAAFYDYEIWQMDVKTAFLNGYLDEDIYMVQPEGFVDPNHPRKVCKLQRSIYGLKQASRSWNKRFDEEIKKFGFAQNLNEPCVYQKASGSNVTFLILYVDDIIIMGNHIPSLQSVKDYLGKCFAMKDLGEATFILGIKIYRDRSKRLIRLGQNAYMDKILKRYKMDTSKHGHIPMQERLDLNKTQGASTPKEVKSALHFANELGVQRGTRHYHRRYHYVRESIALGEIRFLKVHTDDNMADPFTKALSNTKLIQHARSMRLHLASSFM
ncbi:retrotransposon protein, putative, ty1-copia subclass [Tanacetum coccineum]